MVKNWPDMRHVSRKLRPLLGMKQQTGDPATNKHKRIQKYEVSLKHKYQKRIITSRENSRNLFIQRYLEIFNRNLIMENVKGKKLLKEKEYQCLSQGRVQHEERF